MKTLTPLEFLKHELDKINKNIYLEIDGMGNTNFVVCVMQEYAEYYHKEQMKVKKSVIVTGGTIWETCYNNGCVFQRHNRCRNNILLTCEKMQTEKI